MQFLRIYSKNEVSPFLNLRAGETKFGEKVNFIKELGDLKNHPATYVLVGIPEDIGVRANYGNPGTSKAWKAALGSLLNIQHTHLMDAGNLILLGEVDCEDQMEQAEAISMDNGHAVEELGELVIQIDHMVSQLIQIIVEAGKFPIIIGGGHNNSYGNLKGASLALKMKVNSINFDAHTDFRNLEHRHSGNGFSYAFEDGYLDKYFIFGLHRNYTSEGIFNVMDKNSDRIGFNLFEDISITEKISFAEALQQAQRFSSDRNFGIELDLDAVKMMGSSALTPSGFTLTEARKFVSYFSRNPNAVYLHICEGAPSLGIFPNQVGKAIAYLVSDAIAMQ